MFQRPIAQNQRQVRNAGLHYCCYQLSRHGWDAELAERNHRGVDIIASHGKSDTVEIRVKTLGEALAVPLGPSLDHIHVDLWMIVNGLASPRPAIYMLWPRDVERHARLQGKGGRVQFWLDESDYDREDRLDAWQLMEQAARQTPQLSESAQGA
jgi:hypothetical protein